MAYLREFTWYWHAGIEGGGWRVLETPNPTPWDWLDYIPPPVGTEIYLGPGWMNDSEVPVTGHMVVRIRSPAGVLHDYFTPEETLDPHTGKFTTLPPFVLNEAGTWEMLVWLIIDDVAQDYKTVNFATEAPEVIDGHIFDVLYWIAGMANWTSLETYPTTAKAGDAIHLLVAWVNDGSSAAVGHIDVQITSPELYPYLPDAVLNQDGSATPGNGLYIQFAPVTLNEGGSWEFYAQLKVDGVSVDTKTLTFTVEAPVEIPTNLTITAPDTVNEGETFDVITTLTTEAGAPLSGMETVLTVPEIPEIILSAYTLEDGTCEFMLSLPQGTYTLRADFAGTETYNSSRVTGTISANAPIAPALQIAGSTVTGLALFVYGIS